MAPPFAVYLFDIDGTLLDSAGDICVAMSEALATTPRGAVSPDGLKRYVGVHLLEMFRDLLPDYSADQYDDLIQRYRTLFVARQHQSTRVFPGVAEALKALRGRKSTATTKGTPMARTVLERFGLLPYFDHVQGTDGFPYKPAPDVIHASLNALGASPEDCLFVGDAPADMEAGRRAGVKICAVRYGYGDPSQLARWNPDFWVSDLRELAPQD